MNSLVYVTFPYPFTLADVSFVLDRAAMARKWCYEMLELGHITVCPLLHHHLISTHGDPSADRWMDMKNLLLKQMDSCESVQVLKFKGWEESLNVKDTILYAQLNNKPVVYIETKYLEAWFNCSAVPGNAQRSDPVRLPGVPVRALADDRERVGSGELRDAESVDGGC